MCNLFIFSNPEADKKGYRFILASNRDEMYQRPAKRAEKWENTNTIGGRDMEPGRENGTWLALSCDKEKIRVASLLNVTGEVTLKNAEGRGFLVVDYVNGDADANEYLQEISKNGKRFNAFNFVANEISRDNITNFHYSNADPQSRINTFDDKILGFGNSLPETPLLKIKRGKQIFSSIVEKYNAVSQKEILVENVLSFLKNKEQNLPDDELKRRAPQLYEKLSSIFIEIPEKKYGTRTHTIILVDYEFNVDFIEYTMAEPIDLANPKWIRTDLQMRL